MFFLDALWLANYLFGMHSFQRNKQKHLPLRSVCKLITLAYKQSNYRCDEKDSAQLMLMKTRQNTDQRSHYCDMCHERRALFNRSLRTMRGKNARKHSNRRNDVCGICSALNMSWSCIPSIYRQIEIRLMQCALTMKIKYKPKASSSEGFRNKISHYVSLTHECQNMTVIEKFIFRVNTYDNNALIHSLRAEFIAFSKKNFSVHLCSK